MRYYSLANQNLYGVSSEIEAAAAAAVAKKKTIFIHNK